MRLIDADAFREELCKHFAGYGTHESDTKEDIEWNEDLAWFIEQMDNQPTVTPEEDWIPFRLREMTEEERAEHRGEKYMWDDNMPEDGQEILVSDGKYVWDDTFMDDGDVCYLESHDYIYEGMAWMPKPKPYKPKEEKHE